MTACPFGTDYSALSQSTKVWSFPDLHGDESKHPHLATKTEYISLIRESFSVKLITERLVPASGKECIIDLLSWSTLLQNVHAGGSLQEAEEGSVFARKHHNKCGLYKVYLPHQM